MLNSTVGSVRANQIKVMPEVVKVIAGCGYRQIMTLTASWFLITAYKTVDQL